MYEPGVCNVGEAARRRRYGIGAVGALVTLAFVLAGYLGDLPPGTLLLTVAPLFVAAEGYFGGRFTACAPDAAGGVDGVESADRDVDRWADTRRARRVHAYSLAAAVVGAGLVTLVGVLVRAGG